MTHTDPETHFQTGQQKMRAQDNAAQVARQQQPRLNRQTFSTSRLLDFVGQRELTAQIGHPPEEWAIVVAKELLDNALDAAEEAGTAPDVSIAVSTERGEIVVTDNGPGLPAETIDGVLDFSVRVSSRDAYVSPSRGQQGNALKTLIAMPFALDGTRGVTVIESHGLAHRIVFEIDAVRREPRILREIGPSDVQNGTRVTVHWPETASHLLADVEDRFVQTVSDFSTFNPHLTLRAQWDGEQFLDVPATNPDWHKWRACDPTSAYWYGPERFSRYIAAHIARDQDLGRTGRTVRDFVAELRGLTRSAKQKLVLAETGAAGVPLATYFADGRGDIATLLLSCQRHTKPVKPEDLGLIGADHLLTDCQALGAAPESFKYKRVLGMTPAGLPFAIEAAFAWCPDRASERRMVTGVNFSVGIGSPFERLGLFGVGLGSLLARQHVEYLDPVVFVLHYTCPAIEFADRGKGSLSLPRQVVDEISGLVEYLTRDWAKQRRKEQKSANAEARRAEVLLRQRHRPEKRPPAQPDGLLADVICGAADECDRPPDELAVLSAANDPYLAWRRRTEAEWFAGLFDRMVPVPGVKHLRGFFYLLVNAPELVIAPDGKRFVNDYKHWQMLQSASKAARWLGLVAFDRIIDERNNPPEIFVPTAGTLTASVNTGAWCEIPTAKAVIPSPSLGGYADAGQQTHRIVLYGEKSSLAQVLRPIAEEIGAEMILVTGESSDSHIAAMAQRANADGRPAVVLYFSDFDPSGHQMPVSVARKLQALRDLYYPDLKISLYPVALTIEQVRAWGLPSAPLKETERRAAHWRETHGHEQTEIDAAVELHPDLLRQALYDAVAPFYDLGLRTRAYEAEAQWRTQAEEAMQRHPGYQQANKRIATAWKRARAAASALHRQQSRLAVVLQDSLPPPPPIPEAKPKGQPKPALFDSAEDFVTATRRLIRHKRLRSPASSEDRR